MFLYKLLFLGIMCSNLFGGIEQYFKKAEGKSSLHSFKNIDCIYLINLDERPEKLELCLNQLYQYAIFPYRFSAVNGWKLSLKAINDVGVVFQPGMTGHFWGTTYPFDRGFEPHHEIIHQEGKTYFAHCMSRGAIGIALSHLSILQDAYDAGYEIIWIMEDDIQIVRSPHLLPALIDQLDAITNKEWDILFTDRDTKDQQGHYVPCTAFAQRPNFVPAEPSLCQLQQNINHEFRRVGARYGAYSMIVRRSGMKKILDFLKNHKIFLPYDMEFTLPPGIRFYTVQEDVVSTLPKALSDNGNPGYLKK